MKVPYELRPGICDTGIVQTNSVTHDDDATTAAAVDFYTTFDERADREADALRADDVGAIVVDIAPLGLAVAARLGVPSVFIANFTWDWIYEGHAGLAATAPRVIDTIRRAHATATIALRLPLSPSFDGTGLGNVRDLPLIARRATHARDETRAHFGLPALRKTALLSFGGYGLSGLDLANIDCADDWDFVVTDRSVSDGAALPHVHPIAELALSSGDFRYEDLVAAADAVITKPGFGIIGECATAGTPMVYTSRGDFREYDVLVEEMPKILRCAFISQSDLFGGRWRVALDAALSRPEPSRRLEPTGAEDAAAVIAQMASQGMTAGR
jgi:L-arabinokinase